MSSGHQHITWRRNIAENFNRLSRVHERYRQTTDRQTTDGRTTTYSEHEHEFTFAKNSTRSTHKKGSKHDMNKKVKKYTNTLFVDDNNNNNLSKKTRHTLLYFWNLIAEYFYLRDVLILSRYSIRKQNAVLCGKVHF